MAHSGTEFIRALKASADPPQPGGPAKIEIAQKTWENNDLYIPNKGEAIAEWILTRFLKEKGKQQDKNPMADIRFWLLLQNVLSAAQLVKTNTALALPLKTWILPLLNRIPLAPITISFFTIAASTEDPDFISLAFQSLLILWPFAVPRISTDALLECFGAVLGYLPTIHDTLLKHDISSISSKDSIQFSTLVIKSYRNSFGHFTNKKKIYSSFTGSCLQRWLECIILAPIVSQPYQAFMSEMYNAGIDTVFNVDTLRSAHDQRKGTALDDALAKLLTTHADTVVTCLPQLLDSYVQTTRKYRSTLFGQGSRSALGASAEQARTASMKFFGLCDSLLHSVPESQLIWKTQVALLTIVDNSNLVNMRDDVSTGILRQIGDLAISVLSSTDAKGHTDLALASLSTLTHIDYDLIPSALSRVLPKLVMIPHADSGIILTYLNHMLSYHTKTRTMDTYILASLDALTGQLADLTLNEPRSAYNTALSGPLLQHTYLDRLAQSVQGFITPGQVLETVEAIIHRLRLALETFEERDAVVNANDGESSRKKRKRDQQSTSSNLTVDPEMAAVSFALLAKTASTVLPSIPLQSLLDETRQDVQSLIQSFYSSTIRSSLKTSLKKIKSEDRGDTWGWQVVTVSLLSLRYHLATATQLPLSLTDEDKLVSRLFSTLKTDTVLLQLRVEILRSLLFETTQGRCDPISAFEEVLQPLEQHPISNNMGWSGQMHDVTDHSQMAVAVLHLLIDRWLPLCDVLASPEQIKRLATILTTLNPADWSSKDAHLTMSLIFTKALRNAEFWELHHMRNALLSCISEQTAPLDKIELSKSLTSLEKGKNLDSKVDVSLTRAAYEILLFAPPECLSRTVRADLLGRALAADVAIGATARGAALLPEQSQSLIVLREFARRVFAHMGTAEHPSISQYLTYLMDPPFLMSDTPPELTTITLQLVAMHLNSLISLATKGNADLLNDILRSFIHSPALNIPPEQASSIAGLRSQSAILLVDLATGHKMTEFQTTILESVGHLQNHLYSTLLAQMITLAPAEIRATELLPRRTLLELWCSLLRLRKWLKVDGQAIPQFGRALAGKLLAAKPKEGDYPVDIYTIILSMMLEELDFSTDRAQHLDLVVAIYLAFYRSCGPSGRSGLDDRMSKTCKSLPVPDFCSVLDLVLNGLSMKGLGEDDLMSLIHLSSILVHDAPEGTLRVTQHHVTECLSQFAFVPQYREDTTLMRRTLSYMSQHFNDRPAAIKSMDATLMWSIFNHVLRPSTDHDDHTDRAIYHEMLSTLSALIRLRRDLLRPSFPMLVVTMRQLIICIKNIQPHLGRTQTKMVADTLPKWINTEEPLGVDEAKDLARLFTSLTTKTVVRIHGSSAETQKAESLARAFQKHVAGVLAAYCEVLNEPLCMLPSNIRAELQPGLFALCDIIGERHRDVLMVRIDSGGQAVLKALWKEYEKQRYVGKG